MKTVMFTLMLAFGLTSVAQASNVALINKILNSKEVKNTIGSKGYVLEVSYVGGADASSGQLNLVVTTGKSNYPKAAGNETYCMTFDNASGALLSKEECKD